MNKISAVLIAFNEEKIIANCLKKLNWVDEIIVVDSGSNDNTVKICESFKAKVVFKKFNGFGEQKQFAVSQAQNDWILSLDADEILSDKLIEEIKNISLENDEKCAGYFIKRKHIFMNKIFNYGNESDKKFLRLFNKKLANFNNFPVHEFVETKFSTKELTNDFLHYSYGNLNEYIQKLNRYTDLYANDRFLKGKKFSVLMVVFKTKFEFFKKYILEKNVLNGKAGFYWSLFSSFYMFTKCVKTNEKFID